MEKSTADIRLELDANCVAGIGSLIRSQILGDVQCDLSANLSRIAR
ncbi:MAG TPA: hypothetical protein VHL12_02055 [Gemmatimonadaceae bacterium]|nr:hypothetical protein [Gemmatimonadaceae bacterium]